MVSFHPAPTRAPDPHWEASASARGMRRLQVVPSGRLRRPSRDARSSPKRQRGARVLSSGQPRGRERRFEPPSAHTKDPPRSCYGCSPSVAPRRSALLPLLVERARVTHPVCRRVGPTSATRSPQEVVEEGLLAAAAVAGIAVTLVLVAAELLEYALRGLAIEAGLAATAGRGLTAAPRALAQERLVVFIPAVEGLGLALEDLVELTAIQPDAAARTARVHAHTRALHLDQ